MELTGLELIDESTGQMPSISISTNNESLTEVNRATPASLSRQVQDGVGPVSTDSVGPLEYSAYVRAPTGGSSIDERGGKMLLRGYQIGRSSRVTRLTLCFRKRETS